MLTFCSGGIPPDGYLHSIDLRNWKLSGEGRLQLHAFTSQRKSLMPYHTKIQFLYGLLLLCVRHAFSRLTSLKARGTKGSVSKPARGFLRNTGGMWSEHSLQLRKPPPISPGRMPQAAPWSKPTGKRQFPLPSVIKPPALNSTF